MNTYFISFVVVWDNNEDGFYNTFVTFSELSKNTIQQFEADKLLSSRMIKSATVISISKIN